MAWLTKTESTAAKKLVSERRTTDEEREGYWYNGNFITTRHQTRTRVVTMERYPAMTLSAAQDLVNDWDTNDEVEGTLQERNAADCYDVMKTTTVKGTWVDV